MAKGKKDQAREQAQKALKKAGSKKRSSRGFKYYLWMISVLGVALAFLPTTVLLGIGMTPTLVARLVDGARERTASMTVGAMNLAGCFPFMIQLWEGERTVRNALSILIDPMTLLVIFASAAVGWVIFFNIPPMVSMIMVRQSRNRVREIEKRQKLLVELWGGSVTGKARDILKDRRGVDGEDDKEEFADEEPADIETAARLAEEKEKKEAAGLPT